MRSPVFLINLDRQPDRLEFMLSQMKSLHLEPIVISAVDGRQLEDSTRTEVAFYASLTPGEIGCFESHRKIWKKIVDEDLESAFVIEDDVIIASDFPQLDFENLDLPECDLIKIDRNKKVDSYYGSRQYYCTPKRYLTRFLGTEFCTGGYFVTNRGAKKLLSLSRNYFLPVDRFMFWQMSKSFWEMNVWKLHPAAVSQTRHFDTGKGKEIEEDSISASRISGKEKASRNTLIDFIALRLRLLMDMDIRKMRERRCKRALEKFREDEQIESKFVEFYSESLNHVPLVFSKEKIIE